MARNTGWMRIGMMVWALGVSSIAQPAARLVCDEPIFDFGRVDQRAVVTNVFHIRNEGDISFVLHSIRSGCGCTDARLSTDLIAPGETAELTAVFTAAGRRGPQRSSIHLIEAPAQMPPEASSPPVPVHPRARFSSALLLRMEGFIDVETRP